MGIRAINDTFRKGRSNTRLLRGTLDIMAKLVVGMHRNERVASIFDADKILESLHDDVKIQKIKQELGKHSNATTLVKL